jgi:hypothetical protein
LHYIVAAERLRELAVSRGHLRRQAVKRFDHLHPVVRLAVAQVFGIDRLGSQFLGGGQDRAVIGMYQYLPVDAFPEDGQDGVVSVE